MLLPVEPETVRVLGSIWTRDRHPWAGLDFAKAVVRNKTTMECFLFGAAEAPHDHHLDVPFCHPDDHPDYGGCVYRVRPRMEPGKKWKGRKVRSVEFVRDGDGWALDVKFASDQ